MTDFETLAINLLREISNEMTTIRKLVEAAAEREADLEKRKIAAMNQTMAGVTARFGKPPHKS